MMNTSKYRKTVDRYDVISFDVFDTLIKRKTEYPTDIFFLAAERIFNDTESCKSFKQKRIEAEHRAREISGEVTLEDIYNNIDISKEEKELLKDAEIQTELENCLPIEKMIKLYNYATKERKKIYIISDMYLPSKVIAEMLYRCGVKVPNNRLYVSNEWKCNKISGELFKKIIEQEGINPHRMIHFGDSIKADLLGARKAGIHSLLTQRKYRFKRFLKR